MTSNAAQPQRYLESTVQTLILSLHTHGSSSWPHRLRCRGGAYHGRPPASDSFVSFLPRDAFSPASWRCPSLPLLSSALSSRVCSWSCILEVLGAVATWRVLYFDDVVVASVADVVCRWWLSRGEGCDLCQCQKAKLRRIESSSFYVSLSIHRIFPDVKSKR